MDQDRPLAADRPGAEAASEPTWAAPAPPSSLAQSSLFTEPSPFSREGSGGPSPAPVAPPYPTTAPVDPTPYAANPYAPPNPNPAGPYPANPYPPNPYPANPYQPPYGGYAPYGYAPVQNQKALLALIFGIAGFVLVSAFIGGFIGIAGVVLGRKARREIDADPQRYTGRAMATAGFWLGLTSIVGTVAYIIVMIAVIAYAPSSDF